MAKGKRAHTPLKASVPVESNKKVIVAGNGKSKTKQQQQPKHKQASTAAGNKKNSAAAAPAKKAPAAAAPSSKGRGANKQKQKQQAPASETESSDEADSEAGDDNEDDDDEESEDDGDDDDEEEDDDSDDEFEEQGSSSEDDDDDDDDDDEDQLTEAERKTRKFTVDREKQIQQMRDDGSLQVASQLHIDDLSSDDEENINTIGNVPLRWYEDYDHIGYDVEGKKIIKSNAGGDGIDMAIAAKDDPDYEYVACVLCLAVLDAVLAVSVSDRDSRVALCLLHR